MKFRFFLNLKILQIQILTVLFQSWDTALCKGNYVMGFHDPQFHSLGYKRQPLIQFPENLISVVLNECLQSPGSRLVLDDNYVVQLEL